MSIQQKRAVVTTVVTTVALMVLIAGFYASRSAEANHNPGHGSGGTQPPPPSGTSAVLVGAGDIANCSTTTDEANAKLLDGIGGTVFTLGDNVYNSGTLTEFNNCYDPTWGRHKARTMPTVGNHEYLTSGASGYFNYFGAAAGDPKKGYYSYDRGDWHVIALNSNCSQVSCAAGSPQEQ